LALELPNLKAHRRLADTGAVGGCRKAAQLDNAAKHSQVVEVRQIMHLKHILMQSINSIFFSY
jgi:hypothetical protein